MKYFTVYRVVNIINGREYTGKHETDNLDDGYLGSGKRILSAVKKYGRENFRKEILHVFDNATEMNAREAEIVTEAYCAREDTYNLCLGGNGGWNYVNKNGLADVRKGGINAQKRPGGIGNIGWKAGASIEQKRLGGKNSYPSVDLVALAKTPEARAKRKETYKGSNTSAVKRTLNGEPVGSPMV